MIEIRGAGSSWEILQAGRVVARAGRYDRACMVEARLTRLARQRRRPCLCCAAPFTSTGPSHRLCNTCRDLG